MSFYDEYWADLESRKKRISAEAFVGLIDRLPATAAKPGMDGLRELMMGVIIAAHDDPALYRATIGDTRERHLTDDARGGLQEGNPVFGLLANQIRSCLASGELQGDPQAVAAMLWTATHGAAMAATAYTDFPFASWRSYATEVIEITLAGIIGLARTRASSVRS